MLKRSLDTFLGLVDVLLEVLHGTTGTHLLFLSEGSEGFGGIQRLPLAYRGFSGSISSSSRRVRSG